MLTNIRQSKGRRLKEAEISTYAGRYYLDTPGSGITLPYIEDPHLRIQKSSGIIGASGTVEWENELRGITRPLARGDQYDYSKSAQPSIAPVRTYYGQFSDESRATLPAWTFREKEQDRWEQPFLDPRDKAFIPFETNLNVRRAELDSMAVYRADNSVQFVPHLPTAKWEDPVDGFTPYL